LAVPRRDLRALTGSIRREPCTPRCAAADVFAAFHPTETNKLLGPYQVGELVQDDKDKTKRTWALQESCGGGAGPALTMPRACRVGWLAPPAFVKDLRDLRLALRDAGLFKSSKLYYLFKVGQTTGYDSL